MDVKYPTVLQVPIYCWVNRGCFSVLGRVGARTRNLQLSSHEVNHYAAEPSYCHFNDTLSLTFEKDVSAQFMR